MKKFFKVLAIILAVAICFAAVGAIIGNHFTGNWNVAEWIEDLKGKTDKTPDEGNEKDPEIPDEKDPDGGEKLHTHTYSKTVVNPTCTVQGYTLYECKCGDTYKMNYTEKLSHHYVCLDCGAVEGESIPSDDGEPADETILTFKSNIYPFTVVTRYESRSTYPYYISDTNKTISSASTQVLLISDWDSAYEEYTYLVDIYNSNGDRPSTCSIDYVGGYYAGSKSSVVVELTFGAHSHNYTTKVVAATCTAQGYIEHTCTCGESYKDNYTAMLAHSYVDYVCFVCGAVDPNKPTHTHSYTETVVEATCTAQGYTLYECECGESYKDNYTEKTAHRYVCSECGSENENNGESSVDTVAYPWTVDLLPFEVRYEKV